MKPVDVLKTTLSTLILVSGATGSVVNLLKGNNIPMAVSLSIVVLAVVIIIAEIRSSAAERRRRGARLGEVVSAGSGGAEREIAAPEDRIAVRRLAGAPLADLGAADRVYVNAKGALVVRALRVKEPA